MANFRATGFAVFGSLIAMSSIVSAAPDTAPATPKSLSMRKAKAAAQRKPRVAQPTPPPDEGAPPEDDQLPPDDGSAVPVEAPPPVETTPVEAPPVEAPPVVEDTGGGLTDEELAAMAEAEAEAEAEVILVTGSAIERRELTTPAPVSVLDKADLDAAGMVTVGDILQNLPSQSNAINIQFNNGGDGSTRINLRGLGTARTLVLLNGRRVVPGGTGADASVDLNAIPMAVIERVEVLKDGASAIYGSDAIGGVVNIITRDEFEGSEATLYTGTTQHGSGGTVYDVSFVTGAKGKKGSVLFSAGYSTISSLFTTAFDYSAFDKVLDYEVGEGDEVNNETGEPGGDGIPDGQFNSGSSSVPGGRFNTDEDGDGMPDPGNAAWDQVVAECGVGQCTIDQATGQPRPFVNPDDLYNFQPSNYLVTPLDRYNVYASGNQEINKYVRGFFEGSYMNRKSDQVLASEPLFLDLNGVVISADSIYNPYGKDIGSYRRRLTDLKDRTFEQNIDTFRLVTGIDGQLPDDLPVFKNWKWEVSYNYGRTQGTQLAKGSLILSHLVNAVGPSFMDGTTPTCGTPTAPIPDCVPVDLLGGADNDGNGSITPEMADYLTFNGLSGGFNEQQTALAQARGQLAKTPWGGDVSMAFGGDFRKEAGAFQSDPLTSTGDTTGNALEPTSGRYNVKEGFAELSIVPIAGKEFAQWVEINGAVRAFKYSTQKKTKATWKLGGLFRTAGGVAVRGTYSTAFRGPSIGELFSGNADDFPTASDPCDTTPEMPGEPPVVLDPNVRRQCDREGLPENFQNQVSQVRTQVGGNPNLGAESADVWTAGIVWEPPMVDGLAITIDYFNFDIANAIQSKGTDVILSNCYNNPDTGSEPHPDCALINRRDNGLLDYITDTLTNVGGNATSGIDFAVGYEHEVAKAGKFRHQVEGTRLLEINETGADGRVLNGLGNYDLGVFPKWKWNFSSQWGYKGIGAGINVRFIGKFDECDDSVGICNDGKPYDTREPDPAAPDFRVPTRQVKSNVTADLFASYALKTEAGNTSITGGINNILDQEPSLIYQGFQADSDASAYDFLGRYFYLRLNQQF